MGDGIQCAYEGCENEAAPRAALCWGHLKQRAQGKPLSPLRPQGRTPRQVLMDAALAFAEANATNARDWKRAVDRLAMAARRYARRVPTSRRESRSRAEKPTATNS